MKKIALLMFFIVGFHEMSAQGYTGYFADNYAGVLGVTHNPASIADSRYKMDFNIVTVSTSFANDYYGINMLNPSFKKDIATITPKTNNFVFAFTDVLGPSAMFTINNKHSFAITTRARAVANGHDVNGKLIETFADGTSSMTGEALDVDAGSPKVLVHAWGEVGVSYATEIYNNKFNYVKGGVTAKYLQGVGMAGIAGEDVQIKYTKPTDANINDVWKLEYGKDIVLNGKLTSEGFIPKETDNSKSKLVNPSSGFGFDIGFVYEYRPNYESYDLTKAKPQDINYKNKNKYLFKFGISVTDIGSITYKDVPTVTYDISQAGATIEKAMNDMKVVQNFLTTGLGVEAGMNVDQLKKIVDNPKDLTKINGLEGLKGFTDITKIISQDDLKKVYDDAVKTAAAGGDPYTGLAELSKKVNPAGLIDFEKIKNDLINPVETKKDIKVGLPTQLHLTGDWNFYKKFFLNLNANLDLSDRGSHSTYLLNTYILSPRYETKHFTFSLPVNYIEVVGTHVGFVMRAGFFVLGSSSAFTSLTSKKSQAADIFFGFKYPLYNKYKEPKLSKEEKKAKKEGEKKEKENTKVVKEDKKDAATKPDGAMEKPTEKSAEKQKEEQKKEVKK